MDDSTATSTRPTQQKAFLVMCVRKLEEAIVLRKYKEAKRVFATLDRLKARNEQVQKYLQKNDYETLRIIFERKFKQAS